MRQDQRPDYFTFTHEQLLRAVKGWCWDCGIRPPNYMVQNEVWHAAWPESDPLSKKRIDRLKKDATKVFPDRPRSKDSDLVFIHIRLCFECLEKRLGRKLSINDFSMLTRSGTPYPDNGGIFLGYALGMRDAAKTPEKPGDKKDEGG